jgi:uncharacterized protein
MWSFLMNPVVHFEIPVGNLAAAKEFYYKAFGWDLKTDDMPGGKSYTSATTTETGEDYRPKQPGAINGGLVERDEIIKAPVVTISVASIEDAIQQVEAAGGKGLTPKQTVPEMGDFAYVADPEGNVVGLWHDFKQED